MLLNEFERVATLGRGTFAEVGCYKCTGKGNRRVAGDLVAIKSYRGEHLVRRSRQIEQEGQVLSALSSSRSRQVRYYSDLLEKVAEEASEGAVHLLLTPKLGGPLHKHMMQARDGRLSTIVAKGYASEIVCALRFIHSEWCIHRDLKASNVLLDERGHISLCDFGSAKLLLPEQGEEGKEEASFDAIGNMIPTLRERGPLKCTYRELPRTFTLTGTPNYIAPEMFLGKGEAEEGRGGHSFAADWWGFGLLLLELLTGQPPQWKSRATHDAGVITLDDGRSWDWDLASCSPATPGCKGNADESKRSGDAAEREEAALLAQGLDLVALLTTPDASERWSRVDTISAHPFFASVEWRAVEKGIHRPPNPAFDRRLGFLDLLEPRGDSKGAGGGEMGADDELSAEQQALFEGY